MKIKNIKTKQILDSRGNPTVEVELETDKGVFLGAAPSGASTGKHEAIELRDRDGKGIKIAQANVRKINKELKGKEFGSQGEVDDLLIKLDGTENKSKLGVNAILPVSIAACRAFAAEKEIPLFKYIREIFDFSGKTNIYPMPKPCFNIIEGGAHAGNDLDVQEFMVIPQKDMFQENFKIGSELFSSLKEILEKSYPGDKIESGDEGGFAPKINRTEEALFLLKNATANHPDTKIGLDVAASQLFSEDKYTIDGKELMRSGLSDFYEDLISRFPIIFIEDAYSEDDWQGFEDITKKLSDRITIVGDDLLTTNIKRIQEAQNRKACNGLILKPNQIGTVTEALGAAKLAKEFGWKIIVSHRSGETCDDFIADLAVGIEADFIKSGAPLTKERAAKYNRLLEIEKELTSK